MFSSSAPVYSFENADSLVQRKQSNTTSSRKPFFDISVNGKSPDANKMKQKPTLMKKSRDPVTPMMPLDEDLSADEYIFSYKNEKDCYDDIWGTEPILTREDIVRGLRKYCNRADTPPPEWSSSVETENGPAFMDVPVFRTIFQPDSIPWKGNMIVEDVEIPPLDFDTSY